MLVYFIAIRNILLTKESDCFRKRCNLRNFISHLDDTHGDDFHLPWILNGYMISSSH